jgi:membrane dipeptidase
MRTIDAHCDLLSQMLSNPNVHFELEGSGADISLPELQQADMLVQFFALYLSEGLPDRGMAPLMTMLDLMRDHVLASGQMRLIQFASDLEGLAESGQIGAVLSVEGADGLGGNIANLRRLYARGVRFLGVTWNYANWAADGVLESRGGGFTDRGRELIAACDELGIVLDVSHLSDRGVRELAAASPRPFIASHSNARRICSHPRNLTDEQITTIISRNGCIGLTFVPWFISSVKPDLMGLLRHVEHCCSLGGVANIGFGSDFDGFEDKMPELSRPADYLKLQEALLRLYSEEQVKGFLGGNWLRFLRDNLPVC